MPRDIHWHVMRPYGIHYVLNPCPGKGSIHYVLKEESKYPSMRDRGCQDQNLFLSTLHYCLDIYC